MVINTFKTKKGFWLVLLFVLPLLFKCAAQGKGTVKKENPPGTIWLRDNLFIDRVPCSNTYYKEYEYNNSRFGKYNFTKLGNYVDSLPYFGVDVKSFRQKFIFIPNPDSAKYKIDLKRFQSGASSLFNIQYIANPFYNFYPIINMPYQGAEAFCKWRTAMIMSNYASAKTLSERVHYHKKIKFRLPTKEEWEYAVTHLPIVFSFNENIAYGGMGLVTESYQDPVYGKHIVGDKNFILNDLSEMVSEKFVAKGRNWSDSTSWHNVNFTTSYQDANNWLTFRCVCEVED